MKAKHILCGIGAILGGVMAAQGAGALTAQEDVDLYFSFNPTIGISLSSRKISIDNLAPGNAAKSPNISITVNSNNAYGYRLLATAGDGADYTNNSLVNGEATFTSVAVNAGTALASLSDNTWGWAKNDVNAYYGLPYITGTPAEILSTSAAGGTTVAFAIGAKAASTQASGEYTNVINFALVGNVEADSIDKVTTMQDFYAMSSANKTSVVASMATNAIYTLTDDRDGTEYRVAKLADGKVWMLDNLALDLTNASVKQELNSYTTNASDLSLSYLKGDRTRNPETDASGNYATAGVSSDWTTNSYSAPLINTSYIDTTGAANKQYGNGSHKYGVYYNYCAASAGSYCYGNGTTSGTSVGNATEDICPKGWSLPTGGASGEFKSLCSTILGATCGSSQAMTATDSTSMQYLLSLPLSGSVNDGSASYQGTYGYFWSSTRNDYTGMYRLSADATNVYPLNARSRQLGYSVRCVLR